MTLKIFRVNLVLIAAVLYGCSALSGPVYVPPIGTDTATVYFGIKEPGADNLGGGSYTVQLSQGGEFSSPSGQVLSTMKNGMPKLLSDVTTTVQGGKPLTFILDQGTNVGTVGYSCQPKKSFCPKPGGLYEVRIVFPSRNGQLYCDAQVEQVINRGTTAESRFRVTAGPTANCT